MRLDDFVMLGTTVPEVISDGRECVCSAGYSQELGSLLRLYPLSRFNAPRRWGIYQAEIEKNSRDSRSESFALRGERRLDHREINARNFEQVGEFEPTALAQAVEAHSVGSLVEANQRRLSLAFIRPSYPSLDFDYNPGAPDAPQMGLFSAGGPEPTGSKRFTYTPRIQFADPEGYEHNLKLREWGAFEFMRKFPEDQLGLRQNLRLDDNCVLLLGNHAQHRSSWLVIAVLHVVPQMSLIQPEAVLA
jgi:hypothetical protein